MPLVNFLIILLKKSIPWKKFIMDSNIVRMNRHYVVSNEINASLANVN